MLLLFILCIREEFVIFYKSISPESPLGMPYWEVQAEGMPKKEFPIRRSVDEVNRVIRTFGI